jgi:hypothetical protein
MKKDTQKVNPAHSAGIAIRSARRIFMIARA